MYMNPRDYKYHFTQFIYKRGGGKSFQKNLCNYMVGRSCMVRQ